MNIADELRAEQDNANSCEKNRRALEFKVHNFKTSQYLLIITTSQYHFKQDLTNKTCLQVKDLQVKLDEAEQQAVKGGRKVEHSDFILF